jgi:hypothetical protein
MSDSPQIQPPNRLLVPYDRELGRCFAQAFPIPESNAFGDLLQAITEAEKTGRLQETFRHA